MELTVDFPGGARVDAHFGSHTVMTDQGGDAPSPFALFLASLGTCAGVYVMGFCRQRGLSTEGIRIVERSIADPKNRSMVGTVELEIQVPPDFPEKYYDALVRSAEQCAVKKHLENPPKFEIATKAVEIA
jgi:ribosomal protein S12 methylthiotransferase accessory factor